MKIEKIEVKNFKAISEQVADFNGCSAIITAGNNKGKTSLLRGLLDRFRGDKPALIVKEGEKKGECFMHFTDGSKIEWNFTEKSERFSYTTKEGLVIKTGVISQIGEKYFGRKFDVDKFIIASEKEQTKILASLIGVDFEDVDTRYGQAYLDRKNVNVELSKLKAKAMPKPVEVESVDVDALYQKLDEVRGQNRTKLDNFNESYRVARHELNDENAKLLKEITDFNKEQDAVTKNLEEHLLLLDAVASSISNFNNKSDFNIKSSIVEEIKDLIETLPNPSPKNEYVPKVLPEPTQPELESTENIELDIKNANEKIRAFDNYKRNIEEYNAWVTEGKKAVALSKEKEDALKAIAEEKRDMIESSKMPEGFSFGENGVMYNGLPYKNNQISSSAKYIAALKLGAMALGELETIHFDASFLDRKSLTEVQEWADSKGLQLLIERPDFDGGEIKYDII